MLFLEIGHLEKSYGERLLLEIELIQAYKGDKIGNCRWIKEVLVRRKQNWIEAMSIKRCIC
ncbi:hypothetical protein AJ85_15470 [Alkalihalobacillus alcalophilus ATCC 27647 = CGMCC 1.3604]|uniref:Uncharacterized protein n=1 Tax=Alkalihalobacillus alcalophilus ATCC 27647 = CGMCC 1.3604 TaxID=1218173 RepID=A0A094WD76_ALKAL|nr:hypothetical protein [Alkalihalobacillus alcalophilus]KGA95709.1 hypothetical protein BALCAV_0220790 [Alkalihalobacillus alcalophilus ATCC 27647 = CGMCC 1.3604]MED1564111.1 hypothetical protein [Alkalihalobacillus alcalophilus]THG89728.1 hypothetical protein AJ85_15470 [Alkalihalobacillus alcalophilus ATCC 27647 = CGMCC 1.3604]